MAREPTRSEYLRAAVAMKCCLASIKSISVYLTKIAPDDQLGPFIPDVMNEVRKIRDISVKATDKYRHL